MRTQRMLSCAAILSVLAAIPAGCGWDSGNRGGGASSQLEPMETAPFPHAEQENSLSFRWSDASTLDLMSSDGTFLRAVIESCRHATSGAPDAVYPGFGEAMAGAVTPPPDPDGPPLLGTSYVKVVRGQEVADGVVEAWYCEYTNHLGYKVIDPKSDDAAYVIGNGGTTRSAWRVEYSRSPGDDGLLVLPPSNQKGDQGAPSSNVFGSWKVLSINTESFAPGTFLANDCIGQAPDTPWNWPLTDEPQYGPEAAAALPPYPGWPEAPG